MASLQIKSRAAVGDLLRLPVPRVGAGATVTTTHPHQPIQSDGLSLIRSDLAPGWTASWGTTGSSWRRVPARGWGGVGGSQPIRSLRAKSGRASLRAKSGRARANRVYDGGRCARIYRLGHSPASGQPPTDRIQPITSIFVPIPSCPIKRDGSVWVWGGLGRRSWCML